MGDSTLLMTSWSSVSCPDVSYLVQVTGHIQNNPQMLMEVSSYWTDRNFFEFPVPCSTSYNVDFLAQNSAGTSRPSQAVNGITGNKKLYWKNYLLELCICYNKAKF